MRKLVIALGAVAMFAAIVPAEAQNRDVVALVAQAPDRYMPREVGKPVDLHYVFGPYVIPPGQDSNRITVDLPVQSGYVTAIAPDLIDATDGRVPTQQEAHIHHAHWFRITNDPNQEYYPGLSFGGNGASWVFGTGEEKTQGRLDDRARRDHAAGNDWDYGMESDGTTPNALIYMIHNKLASTGRYFVILDVTFIPGTREEIREVTGRDIHPLYGQLWGQTKTVTGSSKVIGSQYKIPRDAVGIAAGGHLHPGGKNTIILNTGRNGTCQTDLDGDGRPGVTILNSYKYDHDMRVWPYSEDYQMGATKFGWRAPLHKDDVLVQIAEYALDAAPDGGHPYLNTVSRDGLDHNWYQAMTYTGIYMDREYRFPGNTQVSTPYACSLESLAPRLLGDDTFELQGKASSWDVADAPGCSMVNPTQPAARCMSAQVAELAEDWNYFLSDTPTASERAAHGMVNHTWAVNEKVCAQPGLDLSPVAGRVGEDTVLGTCGVANIPTQQGPVVDTIHSAAFIYAPGDLGLGSTPMLPRVLQGSTLRFVNEDAAANIRHTFTSCAWPCVGEYVSNFPLSDGGPKAFDTGKIGNLDPVDGGVTGSDTLPFAQLVIDPAKFTVGKYSYYCRIHPFMRGGFEVVPAGTV
jgi:hypothetical protein